MGNRESGELLVQDRVRSFSEYSDISWERPQSVSLNEILERYAYVERYVFDLLFRRRVPHCEVVHSSPFYGRDRLKQWLENPECKRFSCITDFYTEYGWLPENMPMCAIGNVAKVIFGRFVRVNRHAADPDPFWIPWMTLRYIQLYLLATHGSSPKGQALSDIMQENSESCPLGGRMLLIDGWLQKCVPSDCIAYQMSDSEVIFLISGAYKKLKAAIARGEHRRWKEEG